MSHLEIIIAAETQNEERLHELLQLKRQIINEKGYKDNTVLIFTAELGYRSILLILLQYDPNLNLQNEDGDTALIVAARYGHYEICVDLIQAGALIDIQNKIGWTALMEACRYGHQYIVQLLVYSEADLELMDKKGLSALIHASLWGHRHIMDDLLSQGAKLNNRFYLPEEYQGNKLEAKIQLKKRALERKLTEEQRIQRQRALINKYYENGDI